MKPPLTWKDVQDVTDWSYENFTDADGKTVVRSDWVQLTRDVPAYGEDQEYLAPAGSFASVLNVSQRRAVVSLDVSLGVEQFIQAYEKTSLLRRARDGDRPKGGASGAVS